MSLYLNRDVFPLTEKSGVPPHGPVGDDAGGVDRGGAGGAVGHGSVVPIALGLPEVDIIAKTS